MLLPASRGFFLQTSQPTLDTFQDLLHKHPEVFYPSRTAKVLQTHWQLMKQYYLLDDQTGGAKIYVLPPPLVSEAQVSSRGGNDDVPSLFTFSAATAQRRSGAQLLRCGRHD